MTVSEFDELPGWAKQREAFKMQERVGTILMAAEKLPGTKPSKPAGTGKNRLAGEGVLSQGTFKRPQLPRHSHGSQQKRPPLRI